MNYYEVYQSRINHLGTTTAERIRNGGIRSFQKWLSESPHTVRNLSVERGLFFDGIILIRKDREYRKDMYLNVAIDIPLKVGDIMNWTQDDGSIEKWLLLGKEQMVNEIHQTFWIVKCNYLLNWFNSLGHREQSWAYFVSSVDSKVKGNYRTWNSLITPQPNKYAEIIMPYYPVDRSTNFIVQDESWNMIDCDYSSVPGTIYMSLTENKINSIYDDIANDIADTDKEAVYDFHFAAEPQQFQVGAPITIQYTLLRNGQVAESPAVNYISSDINIAKIKNGELVAVAEGEADITIAFPDYPTAKMKHNTIHIQVAATSNEPGCYIAGDDVIRLGLSANYTLMNAQGLVIFSLEEGSEKYVSIKVIDDTHCQVIANEQNKLGMAKLLASYGGQTYEKQIQIRSLW